MGSPVFGALGGNADGSNMMSAFMQFMMQNMGKNPNDLIQQMLQSGKLNQNQLNQVQQKAQAMMGQFDALRGNFGF